MIWQILGREKKGSLLERILVNRGLKTAQEKENFLNPRNPAALTAEEVGLKQKEIQKVQKRIQKAINQKEKVIVYGDYDSDGVCATAILWETLQELGVEVMPFIPRREEGYGLRGERIKEMAEAGVRLLLTVDQGIVQYQAAEQARKLGVDLIITDHHLPGDKRPKAVAVIHTLKLSGAGVAWFLAKELGDKLADHFALAAIGTVTDLTSLLGVNRAIVKFGLSKLADTSRVGLVALFHLLGLQPQKITTYEIGFMLGPRLNSSGRLADPLDSLRLLCTRDFKRAEKLAKILDQTNRERQDLMTKTALHARETWLAAAQKESLIFVGHESYHEGVIGLAAGKLTEEFGRPAVVLAKGEEFSKASARSVVGFNIVEAIRSCADLVEAHGGHSLAAGFTIKTAKIELLKTRLQALAAERLPQEKLEKVLSVEAVVPFNQLNRQVFEELRKLEPFGEDNRQPVLATKGVEVVERKVLGADSQHLKLVLREPKSNLVMEAVGFNLAAAFSSLKIGSRVDVAYNLIMDEWNGKTKLQLKIKDIKIRD